MNLLAGKPFPRDTAASPQVAPPVDGLLRESTHSGRFILGMIVALVIHAAILFGWRQAQLVEPPEFGMQAADSSVEVSLVAAPVASEQVKEAPPEVPETVTPPPVEEQPAPEPPPLPEKPPEMTIPEPAPRPVVAPPKPKPVKATSLPKPAPKVARASGDGSSAKPGNDATTALASSGALSAKPGYLRNPEPAYPEQARIAGQQGVVHLRVKVNAQGGVISVQVTHSSGYPLLDERARSTVAERWIFKAARSNGIPVPSEVTIPIRFTLD